MPKKDRVFTSPAINDDQKKAIVAESNQQKSWEKGIVLRTLDRSGFFLDSTDIVQNCLNG
jgi:hypothetical protein